MKNLIYLMALLCCFACTNADTAKDTSSEEEKSSLNTTPTEEVVATPEPETAPEPPASPLLGSYVGMFEASKYDENKRPTWANKINITIDKVTDDLIYGHSVVAGNDRPFSGTMMQQGNYYVVEAKEPGDDRYDGTFRFRITTDGQKMEGTWVANDSRLAVTEREYDLEKRDFRYDPNVSLHDEDVYFEIEELYGTYNETTGEAEYITEAIWSKNASADVLTKADVENMHRGDLEVMRNAIYARHGYTFKNRKMRYVFNYVPWYTPMYTDIRDKLTDLELKNIDLLKRYEQHAERYYDSFGR
ncbi:MAG: YARHG domain-containing protein [Saprospiraceae bacterium]|nr:YARHG domain-containing protein [Lewinella sp.]